MNKKSNIIFSPAFMKWVKNNEELLKDDFFTNLFNINSDIKVDDWGIELAIFKILEKQENMDLPLDVTGVTGNTILEIAKSLFNKYNKYELDKLFPFLEEYTKYMKTDEKDIDEEYRILQKYWI